MSRTWWPVEYRTLGDLRSLLRWMRSSLGPLAQEWRAGSLTLPDTAGVPSYRKLLAHLDADETAVRQIDIYGNDESVREIRALFSAYRRLRRAERRMAEHVGRVHRGQADGRHGQDAPSGPARDDGADDGGRG